MQTNKNLVQLSDELIEFFSINTAKNEVTEYFLLNAAMHGYIEIAKLCLLAGANITIPLGAINTDSANSTPIKIAQQYGHTEIAELLFKTADSNTHIISHPLPHITSPSAAPPDMTNIQAIIQPLVLYFHSNSADLSPEDLTKYQEIRNILIEWMQLPETIKKSISYIQQESITILLANMDKKHVVNLMKNAIENKNVALQMFCLQATAHPEEVIDDNGNTLLHHAVHANAIIELEHMLTHLPNINVTDKHGNTPLHAAMQLKSIDMIALLIQHGAKPNYLNEKNVSPSTMISSTSDNYTSFLMLHQNHHARKQIKAEYICQTYIKQIMGNRAAAIASWKAQRATPQGIERLSKLHDELSAFFNLECDEEDTLQVVFEIAATHGLVEILRFALENGADIEHKNDDGKTALMLAQEGNHHKAGEFLASCTGQPSKSMKNK